MSERQKFPSQGPRTVRLSRDDSQLSVEAAAQAVRERNRPVLVVLKGSDLGRRERVEGGAVLGRDPKAAFFLNDPGVSWHHARFDDRGDGWAIVDLGSTNGTKLNGARVTEAVLQAGDKIAVGRTVLRFEMQDPTEQQYDAMVERLLNVDELTGLYVRRRFDAELERMLREAAAEGRALGLLVMDLDGTKAINDANGHLFGAYTIGEAGRVIGRVLGDRGIAARFGGDEFLAAVRDANVKATVDMGERILQAVAAHHFEHEGVVLRPGISVGVAAFPESARDPRSLFQRADEALYRAKRAGKNRVAV
ncbi:MAG: GGDEF domain-containing protein [Myxococcota bacterium]